MIRVIEGDYDMIQLIRLSNVDFVCPINGKGWVIDELEIRLKAKGKVLDIDSVVKFVYSFKGQSVLQEDLMNAIVDEIQRVCDCSFDIQIIGKHYVDVSDGFEKPVRLMTVKEVR